MITYFKDLITGDHFTYNGNHCTKKSSRTAWIDGRDRRLWFYFSLNESVVKGWK